MAAAFPAVAPGTSCTQSAFKVGKRAFLDIGPGPRGVTTRFTADEPLPDALWKAWLNESYEQAARK